MRILHLTDGYLPDLGGIEMHVADLAVRQQRRGHDVRVMTRTPAGPSAAYAPSPVPVERVRCGPLGAGSAVRAFVERERVDLVHAHVSVVSPLALSGLGALRGMPLLATVHSVLPDRPALLRAMIATTGLRADDVVLSAVSDVAARPWRRALGAGVPVHVLTNGIDPQTWAGEHEPPPGPTFTVVSVGRLARRKRVGPLLRVLADVAAGLPSGVRLRAVVVGEGRQRRRLEADVRALGLADVVELTGALTREQIRTVLHRADAYVAPARLESFGIAALEARCAGLPVVATTQGGAGEFVVDGREGLLVADDRAMADALLRLAHDPALRERIRRHNTTTTPTMAWPEVLERHDHLYAHAMEQRSARGRRALAP